MASPDPLERLTDLVLVLLGAERPLTLDQIAQEVPGYPDGKTARRQMFERDKKLLRSEGIPVLTEAIEGKEQFAYRIDPDAFYLPDLGLTADEQAALHLAVAGVHLGDPSGRDALAKLGASGMTETNPVATLVPPPALISFFDAVRTQSLATFVHRGTLRHVSASNVWFRNGRWYVIGFDHDRDDGRTFRIDRVDGDVELGEPGSAHLPEGFDSADRLPDEPWRVGDHDTEAVRIRIDPIEAARIAEEVGSDRVVDRGDDGSITVELNVSHPPALRSFVLGLLDHAEILEPPEYRSDIVSWLETVAAQGPLTGRVPKRVAEAPTRTPAVTPLDARKRLKRLLAMVTWLAKEGVVPTAEVARRFSMTEAEVVHELELAACCGTPPYTPDTLMEIVVTADTVEARLPADLARPRRLTSSEGFALSAAARTILAVPGADDTGSLASAASKLDAALGEHGRLVVDLDEPTLLAEVQAALLDARQLEIEYHSASSDETTTRVIDPIEVVSFDGHWYLDAYCHRAGNVRRFRVDRIRRLRDVGERGPIPTDYERSDEAAYVPGPGARTVTLALEPEAQWITETVAVLASEPDGDSLLATFAVGGTAWLERTLLQLGPGARVIGPSEFDEVGPTAAARVLARYRLD